MKGCLRFTSPSFHLAVRTHRPRHVGGLLSPRASRGKEDFGLSDIKLDLESLERGAESAKADIFDTKALGKRGEVWFVGQLVAILLVLFPPSAFDSLGKVLGVFSVFIGGSLIVLSAQTLGGSLTPFPKPLEDAQLSTSGPYELIRHPMYTGLLTLFAGITALTPSDDGDGRTVALVVLGLVLFFKAQREDQLLRDKFGAAHEEWCKDTGLLFPTKDTLDYLIKKTVTG